MLSWFSAAAITSAGRSTSTPSMYLYASSGEYAGGGREPSLAALSLSPSPAALRLASERAFPFPCEDIGVNDLRWMDSSAAPGPADPAPGDGSGKFMGDSGGGWRRITISAAELPRLWPPARWCARALLRPAGAGEIEREWEWEGRGRGDWAREESGEEATEVLWLEFGTGGEAGRWAPGVWKGVSVGEIYRSCCESCCSSLGPSSEMGVIGGGGLIGVGGGTFPVLRGEDCGGAKVCLDLLERLDEEGASAVPGETDAPPSAGLKPPPASRRMLPLSLPYAGGGASVPTLGASPHFFTFASMNTNPDWPRFTWRLHGPSAPTVGKRFQRVRPM